ncbi:cystathionine beta-lyase [Peribacillus psychrosaccharolyticus]|uniref:cysteine-S-conjugate beta-lyase n=1 Tax=Peribacillus psychrosaccharolyticus TaxID=1407 RepID=A0A974NQW0_PERPY|nr:cystathionine beta-lyase [Peribacillus psychrosaccharolyticus]MEC2054909.1 cystathionine beta-lyase [Peribacillus psychrosaccharolyticus]MED3744648.1 cystathionine beta-lyase [Peribacillus psychrosaccharolyticus]QQT02167.1 cystathionine beta-lyase [Peribacillus psychrosaccharolyticus]
MTKQSFSFETQLLHNRHKIDPETGAVNVPIHLSSTFHQFAIDQFGKYDYSRSGNPTREALEDIIADLEEGTNGFAFASGMAAISTAFLLLSAGDHVIVSEDVYGGTYRMVTSVLTRFNIEHTFVDMTNIAAVEAAIQSNTKAIYIETPSNPLLKVTDIKTLSALAKQIGALTYVDNTFLTPALQKPLTLGADIVLHSATKFLSGHSDAIAGLAVVKDPNLAEQLGFLQNSFGAVLGVQDAWLVMRGIKTLHVRIQQSVKSAQQLAEWLEAQNLVKTVHYPGLVTHRDFQLQQEQASGAGAVLSFELVDEELLADFVQAVKLPVFAVSLGAVESILSYPAKMSHAAIPKDEREKRGITNSLLRLSVGLENPDDLIQDFSQAFEACTAQISTGASV